MLTNRTRRQVRRAKLFTPEAEHPHHGQGAGHAICFNFAPIPASFGRIDHRHAKRHEEIWLRHQGEGDGSASHLRHDGPVV